MNILENDIVCESIIDMFVEFKDKVTREILHSSNYTVIELTLDMQDLVYKIRVKELSSISFLVIGPQQTRLTRVPRTSSNEDKWIKKLEDSELLVENLNKLIEEQIIIFKRESKK